MKMLWKEQKGEKRFLLGNEGVARGALEAGLAVFACYPGTPSSEVADTLYSCARECQDCAGEAPGWQMEYSVNEKVALEVAAGAAIAGAPAMAAMKHVGLNVAADPLFTAAYVGMRGGLVVLSADDPGCHSSQNEQDNRAYARFAGLPCFEPVSPQEAKDMTREAFALARELEQPVLLRTTTRVSHLRGPVEYGEISRLEKLPFERAPHRYVPVPVNARERRKALAANLLRAEEMAENSPFNILGQASHPEAGIIASGVARAYLADALKMTGLTNQVDVFELGMTWPLPRRKLASFLDEHKKVLVLEEGPDLLEKDVRALAQKLETAVKISGKDQELGEMGEYSASLVKNRILRWLGYADQSSAISPAKLPGRPPNLCPGCAHRSVYYAARRVFGDDAVYSTDIGCYTLGLLPPLRAADFMVCMGSSVSSGSGFARASGQTVLGFIGDSTFFHSGITGLANAVYNKHDLILTILDNGATAMTGHQPNPGMIQEKLGENATHLDIESIVKGLGVRHYVRVKSHNLGAVTRAYEELKNKPGTRVLIAEEPCLLFARKELKKKKTHVAMVKCQNEETERCLRELACPAFTRKDGQIEVDEALCGGCMLCLQIAPGSFASKKI